MNQTKQLVKLVSLDDLRDAIKNSDSEVIMVVPESCDETERNRLVESAAKKFKELSEIAGYERPVFKRKRPRISGAAKVY